MILILRRVNPLFKLRLRLFHCYYSYFLITKLLSPSIQYCYVMPQFIQKNGCSTFYTQADRFRALFWLMQQWCRQDLYFWWVSVKVDGLSFKNVLGLKKKKLNIGKMKNELMF